MIMVRPKKWWDWINPWFWRRAKLFKLIIEHQMEQGVTTKNVKDWVLYAKGETPCFWQWKGEENNE